MLDLKFVREHLEEVKEKVGWRGQAVDWNLFAQLDSERRNILQESESLRAKRNQVSDLIAEMKKKKEEAAQVPGPWIPSALTPHLFSKG